MSVSCLDNNGDELISFDFSESEWNLLKSSYPQARLTMKCCGAPAVPKTSHLGTQFFAHQQNSCGEGRETLEHIMCKQLVVKGARDAGWKALPECAGEDADGNKWVADVLCLKGQSKVAFEIQLAAQAFGDYKNRTIRYAKSGVRCLWLIRRSRRFSIARQMIIDRIGKTGHSDIIGCYPDRHDMPLFQVDVTDRECIYVVFPLRQGRGPYDLPLDVFTCGFLSGRLLFKDGLWLWGAEDCA
jgi:hypothetical protein